jgi:hypothetical protein
MVGLYATPTGRDAACGTTDGAGIMKTEIQMGKHYSVACIREIILYFKKKQHSYSYSYTAL